MSEPKENTKAIELECPGCAEVNTFDQQQPIICKKCTKSMSGRRYKVASLGVLPFIFGAVGYGLVDRQILAEERYPLEYEFAVANSCINGDQSGLSWQSYSKKQDICLCAVGKTINGYPYSDFKKDPKAFSTSFNRNISECL